jgi:predicted Zn-dependent peptidase
MKETLKVVFDWIDNGITKEELENTKNYFTSHYQVEFERSSTVLQYISSSLRNKRDLDYYYNRIKIIQSLSLVSNHRIVEKYLFMITSPSTSLLIFSLVCIK